MNEIDLVEEINKKANFLFIVFIYISMVFIIIDDVYCCLKQWRRILFYIVYKLRVFKIKKKKKKKKFDDDYSWKIHIKMSTFS